MNDAPASSAPMRRHGPHLISLLVALVLASALAAPAHGAALQGRVFGGDEAPAGSIPWQVALVVRDRPAAASQFCGGAVRDATHVVTAAHCVQDLDSGAVVPAATIDVLAGTVDLTAGGQRVAVAGVAVHPDFDAETMTHDVALLTLAEPLTFGAAVWPIGLVDDATWAATAPGRGLQVSGWGLTEAGDTTRLRRADVPLRADSVCDAQYGGALTTELMLCAGDGVRDSCSGDSGGPLALDTGTAFAPAWRLVGVVSLGGASGCASDTQYGVYAEVAAPRIRSFLQTGVSPPAAGTPTAPSPTGSAPSPPATATPPATAPEPAPPVPAPAPPTRPDDRDAVAPVATVTRAACTRTRCVLDLRVVDAGISRGLRGVRATVVSTTRTRCRRPGRRPGCTRTRTRSLRAVRVAAGRYRLVLRALPAGRHAVAVRATDAAGNRQIVAARRTLRTPARRR